MAAVRERVRAWQGVISAPSDVPLPPDVRPPERMEYAGMLRETVNGLARGAAGVAIVPGARDVLLRLHCDRYVRTLGVAALVRAVFAAGLRPAASLGGAQARLEALATAAEAAFGGEAPYPPRAQFARDRLVVYVAAVDVVAESTLGLLTEPARIATEHVDRLVREMRACGVLLEHILNACLLGSQAEALRGLADLCAAPP